MPVSVVVGGQFGSEGKGKTVLYMAKEDDNVTHIVRSGGPNAGHTGYVDGEKVVLRHLPIGVLIKDKPLWLYIAANSYIDLDVLKEEIETYLIDSPHRLLIDPKAVIITADMKKAEADIGKSIGSTCSGTGAAITRKISRERKLTTVKDIEYLKPWCHDTLCVLQTAVERKERVVIEGTQGFELSLTQSQFYPYVTSRDVTAGALLAEVGLHPFDLDQVILVLRTYPIRVAGNSGSLPNETNWEFVTTASGQDEPIKELTSVSKKLRRVGRFNSVMVSQAVKHNQPTVIVMNHLDYIKPEERMDWIQEIEAEIGQNIDVMGIGPEEFISRRTFLEEYL